MSNWDYWTDEKIAELKARKAAADDVFRRDYPTAVADLLIRGLQSVYWNDGFFACEKALDKLDKAASEHGAEVSQLESKLNDAFYERDAAVEQLADLRERLESQDGAE